jgi:hypothetical protein
MADRTENARSVSHQPRDYPCPLCMLQRGVFDERNQPADVVGVAGLAYARIAPNGGLPTLGRSS